MVIVMGVIAVREGLYYENQLLKKGKRAGVEERKEEGGNGWMVVRLPD